MLQKSFKTLGLAGAIMFGAAVPAAHGVVDVIDQQAGISVYADADGESESITRNITAGDPLPYNQTRTSQNVGETVRADSTAVLQTYSASTSGGLSISSSGSFDVSTIAAESSVATAVGSSGFSIRFDIDRPAFHTVTGSLSKQDSFLLGEDESLVYAKLEQVNPSSGDPATVWELSANAGTTPINVNGAVLAGNSQYILSVQALGWVQAFAPDVLSVDNNGSFDIDFDLTEADAGDTDVDGDVDLSDLGALATNYGTTSGMTWQMGDFDYDGDVDLSDLGSLATNYGAGAAQARADFQFLTSAPEPAGAMVALAVAMVCDIATCRRRNFFGVTNMAAIPPLAEHR